ncbi:MAG: 4-hydroxy-3-methylbut-2-enyl diphosphate reductase [Lentisphaerae bacterium]|nr:4-hydroxy-3-methylbut-2-enyl diphosphate reductase [Lentisphaerota bacterium]
MQIHLAKSAGFCFGVRRAIKIARELAAECPAGYMLGDLVHNETVIRELEAAGLHKIKRLRPADALTRSARGRAAKRPGRPGHPTLLLRAHGVARRTLALARGYGYMLVDATCPMVHEIHRIVRACDRERRRVIIIGDRRHEEVLGISGQIVRRAVIIDPAAPLPWAALQGVRKAAVVIQSTQNLDEVLPIVAQLRARIADLKFFNTICNPTRMKQAEIKKLPLENDAMLIIGSRTSANTKRLYEISKALNPRTYWIQSPEELAARWFKGLRTLGITAGASTPEATTRAVIAHIRTLMGQINKR